MILVTGGAGYIGSHTLKRLVENGYEAVVYDNLSTGHKEAVRGAVFVEGDLSDKKKVSALFKQHSIDTVIHFAASAYVGESVIKPDLYYRNNVCNSLNLLEVMEENGVKDFIFSSSCATYGTPEVMPITEETPQNPINPYGMTKMVVERILSDFHKAYDTNFVSLRYFNAAGADADAQIGEDHDPETHVIPLLLQSAYSGKEPFHVFGTNYLTKDGSCIRDYIHVCDLADAHIKAIDYLKRQGHLNCINLGTGQGVSVLELINTVENITGKKINVRYSEKRPGDPAILIASYERAKTELGWQARYSSIENIVASSWKWYEKKVNTIG